MRKEHKDKHEEFLTDLRAVLKKHNVELSLEYEYGSYEISGANIIAEFDWSQEMFDKFDDGSIEDLDLGTYVTVD